MNFEKFKQLQKSKSFMVVLLAILLIIIFFYYRAFFTIGVYFNDTFLKKEVVANEIHFNGKNKYGNINITVRGKGIENEKSSAEVDFMLPNNIKKQFKVYFNYGQWDIGAIEIKDEKENTLFEGKYRKNGFWLYDNNGESVIEENIGFFTDTGEEITYDTDYKLPLKKVAEFSMLENETIRGDFEIMLFAVFLLLITFIDIKSPLLFFTLSHYLHVKDPEPTEFYIAMQRISWVLFPIIGIVMLIVAI